MKKEYWFVILTYLAVQFSGLLGLPFFMYLGKMFGIEEDLLVAKSIAYWSVFSFAIGLLLILFFLRHDMKENERIHKKAPISISIIWAMIGVPLAFTAQIIAVYIEQLIGIQPESANTENLMAISEQAISMVLVIAIFGPILEEIIFRKIIFGSLYKRFNFFISALLSSIIFGIAHWEFEHLILYAAMGFTFAFLYVQTNRILVPIIAHMAMNSFVVIMQFFQAELQEYIKSVEAFIGGFL